MTSLPRGCEVRPLDLGGRHEFGFEVVCKGERAGALIAKRIKRSGKVRYGVTGVNVVGAWRRKRIATKLYEMAAQEACRRRAPLASFERVGGGISRQFWDKQLRKGRARVLSKRGGYENGGKAEVFELPCPAPPDLGRRLSGPADVRLRATHPRGGMVIRAYDGKKKVGRLGVVEFATGMETERAGLLPEYQKHGIGTKMYRKAAKLACERYGKPLRSPDYASSRAAKRLWSKEAAAGNAKRNESGDGFEYHCPVRFK